MAISNVDMLTFFQALQEITDDELKDLEARETMNLEVKDPIMDVTIDRGDPGGGGPCDEAVSSGVDISATVPEPECESEAQEQDDGSTMNRESPDE